MKRLPTLFALLFTLFSCANNQKNDQQQSAPLDSKNYSTNAASLDLRPQVTKPDTQTTTAPTQIEIQSGPNEIINNGFANMPLGFDHFSDQILQKLFNGTYTTSKHPVKNKYVSHVDTLIYFKKGNSVVKFHKTIDKIMIDSLSVEDDGFTTFVNGINIGSSKALLLNKLGINNNKVYGDTISVTNEDYDVEVKIYFDKKNRIRKIHSYTPLD